MLGEFPVVTNWTFKTSFHPRNPNYIATASYDGKIAVRTLQNTNPLVDTNSAVSTEADDFFSRASNAQTSSFSLKQTPKWFQRPVGATFGFGGKLVSFASTAPHQSRVKISTVAVDSGVNAATERFEKAIQEGNLVSVCEEKSQDARSEEKSEWQILKALFEQDMKAKLVEYLGFSADDIKSPEPEKEAEVKEGHEGEGSGQVLAANGETPDRLSSLFADSADSESFLAGLSIQSTQTARTNNPFQIYTGEESEADRIISKAIVMGQYAKAVDVCLSEDRISDAFMLAICGGDKCIEKVKAAYFTKRKEPNYLRLLASVVGKNLWDVVHNADIGNWKEVMVALCTHGENKEFQDLCEALGDRLEEEYSAKDQIEFRQSALLCYLAGSKLHKAINIWIAELHEAEKAGLQEKTEDSTFSVHARSLQNFIEKVTVFREAVKFADDERGLSSGWKLEALYEKYCEYADVVASHGQLTVAGKYLDLLPTEYPAATVARNRVKQAIGETISATQARKPQQPATTGHRQQQQFQPVQPAAYQPTQVPRTTAPSGIYQSWGQPPRPQFPPPPTAPPPPKSTANVANWNDTPDVVRPARRPTPLGPPQPSTSPFPGAAPISPPQHGLPWGAPPSKATPPPPPKGAAPPQRVQSPAGQPFRTQSPVIGGVGYPPQANHQAPYVPPPQQGGRYTPQQPAPGGPVGNPGPPTNMRPNIPPPPQGSVISGRAPGPQYAPPPIPFGQPPVPSPYAPQQLQQGAPSPYAPPTSQQTPIGPYAPPQGNQGPPLARPGSQPMPPVDKPATPAPPPSKHRVYSPVNC
jgi:protein transport protein SEC31